MTETAQLNLPLLLPAQAQKHVTVNEALRLLDGLVQSVVVSATETAPPAEPGEGQAWIVGGPGAVNDWEGWEGDIAAWADGAWLRLRAREGWRVWVLGEATLRVRVGAAWLPLTQALGLVGAATLADGSLTGLGVNAAVDATNRFVFRGTNLLMQSDTGIDATFNKASAAADASLSFKTGYAPRALIGLLGNDDLSVKVGPGFVEALRINHRSGRAVFRRVQAGERPFDAVRRRHVAQAAWKASVSAADRDWRSVAWAPELGLFCAVASSGSGGRVMTSPDGIVWTLRTAAADNDWRSVCWSGELGLFVAVATSGAGNRVMTSADGVVWTTRAAPDNDWWGVCWSPERGLFVAVAATGAGNRVMTSADGVAWVARASAADNQWYGVTWAAELGLFVAVAITGSGNRVMTSADGVAWVARASAADNAWRSVVWAPELGRLVAVATSGAGNRVMTSADGIAWTARSSPADSNWQSVAWAPEIGLFAAVAWSGTGQRVATSPDGIAWTLRSSASDEVWTANCWAPELGLFVAVAATGSGNRVMTSVSARSFSYRS
jgi:hypothetical protein